MSRLIFVRRLGTAESVSTLRVEPIILPPRGWKALSKIILAAIIIVAGFLMLAAQRYVANKRLANERPNKDED
jgi:hypothetical protein